MKIIINADDFGLRKSVNLAIVELLNNKLINSTTLMVNMPGYEESVELIHKYKLENRIGVHLVLTDGLPLTERIQDLNFAFKGKDCTRKELRNNLFFLNKTKKEIISAEFEAQIKKIRGNGIPITHIDTHHQIHDFWGIMEILLDLKRIYNIPSIRILNNLEKHPQRYKSIYRNQINTCIKRKKANFTDYFGSRLDFLNKLKNNNSFFNEKSVEIMVHPDYNEKGIIIDKIKNLEYNFEFPDYITKFLVF
jgi:chitin disaccharide deacetylase